MEDCTQEIRDMISDTKDTFGDLAFKTKKIENNLQRKLVQSVFTVLKKKKNSTYRRDVRQFLPKNNNTSRKTSNVV
jgi:hypothetical protein